MKSIYAVLFVVFAMPFACDKDKKDSKSETPVQNEVNKNNEESSKEEKGGNHAETAINKEDIEQYDFQLKEDLDFSAGEDGQASGFAGTVPTHNLAFIDQKPATGSEVDDNESGCALAIPQNESGSDTWTTIGKDSLLAQSQLSHIFDNGTHYISIGLSQRATFRQMFLICKNALNAGDVEKHLGHILELKKK